MKICLLVVFNSIIINLVIFIYLQDIDFENWAYGVGMIGIRNDLVSSMYDQKGLDQYFLLVQDIQDICIILGGFFNQ